MRKLESTQLNLAGTLLLAHPGLLDPNFRRTVVLLSAHSREEGAMGVILNRPMDKTLADFDESLLHSSLGDVPVYRGGPVQAEKLTLAAWNWSSEEGIFKLFFGIDAEKARDFRADPQMVVRGFFGYSGWSEGQLEEELKEQSWLVSSIKGDLLRDKDGLGLWRTILAEVSPELKILADFPDDPSLN
ncbi:MAG: YqgE/AlgH family protein [Opitutales bacterium]